MAKKRKPPEKPSTPQDNGVAETGMEILVHDGYTGVDEDFVSVFQRLVSGTPRDQNGYLTYFLDHQMIPPDIMARGSRAQTQIIQAAKTPISNLEGYPTFDYSQPVWNQLKSPNEPPSYYSAFRAYLASPARSLDDALREIPVGFTPYTIHQAYVFFYWSERARAYDVLQPVAAARLRDQRVLQLEHSHWKLSSELMGSLVGELTTRAGEQNARPWMGLSTTDLFKSLLATAEMQRVTVGLPAKGPKVHGAGFSPAPFAGIERSVRDSVDNFEGGEGRESSPAEKLRQQIDTAIANDPEKAAQFQQMAIDIMLQARDTKKTSEAERFAQESVDAAANGDDDENT